MPDSTEEKATRLEDIRTLEEAAAAGDDMHIPDWLADTPVGACFYRGIQDPSSLQKELLKAVVLLAARAEHDRATQEEQG